MMRTLLELLVHFLRAEIQTLVERTDTNYCIALSFFLTYI